MRRGSSAITQGEFTQYAPNNGVYVYFRHHENDKVMVVVNKNDKDFDLSLSRFDEMLDGHQTATAIASGETQDLEGAFSIPAKKAIVYSIK